jgi:hypothetical protein
VVANVRISGPQNFRYSESDIRVNYRNQNQIIAAANGLTVQGQFYSWDGGRTWGQTSLSLNPGDDLHSDPAVDWTSDGTAWAITIGFDSNETHLRLRAFKSDNGGSNWSYDADASGNQTTTDKPMAWVDHSRPSLFQDNIYVIWDDSNNGRVFVNHRTGPSGSWQTPVQVSGNETTGTGIGSDIKTNSSGDVFAFWPDTVSQNLFVAKSTDGGKTFAAPVKIATTFGSYQLSIPAYPQQHPFPGPLIYISGGCYRTATKNLVYTMWNDLSGEQGCTSGIDEPGTNVASTCKSRIWFARSLDGGSTWQQATMINNQVSRNDQFFPRICVDETNGHCVAVYYDTVSDPGRVKTDVWMQRSDDDGAHWSAATKVTTAQTDETAAGADLVGRYGDYIGLSGYAGTFFPSWTDRRNGAREEIWTAPLTTPACYFIVDRSTFGQDEVAAKLPNAQFSPAFWVAVSGFTPNELGLNLGNLNNPPNVPAIAAAFDNSLDPTVVAAIQSMFSTPPFAGPVVPLDPSLPDWPQVFLFPFEVDFSSQDGFQAMAAAQPQIVSTLITLSASLNIGPTALSNQTQLELTIGEDPFFIDVDPNNPTQPSWLSFDLRFFKVVQGDSRFGIGNLNAPADAPTFIANVINNLNTPGANLGGDSFDALSQDEDQSALEFQQQVNNQYVFNFALARVRLLGQSQTTAQTVRVFFRLFQAQNTASDFNTNTTYRFASDGQTYGHAIPLLGVQNDQAGNPEYVTIPCFASPRINLQQPVDMATQDDTPNAINVATNPGIEVDTYFGCWLDINQPDQRFLPLVPPPGDFDGQNGWQGVSLHSIQEAITAAPHQCLIAEIRFDDTPIPPGANSGTSDKLAQRNIAWIDGPNPGVVDSRRMPHPVQVRPTPPEASNPDELLIFWGSTPPATEAELFLPMFAARDIVNLAGRLYTDHRLRVRDTYTIGFPARGATLIPIPRGNGLAAGLLTIDLPPGIRKGDSYAILVRQLTDALGEPPPPPIQLQARPRSALVSVTDTILWRRVLGAFQFGINIHTRREILLPEERLLAVLRWIELVMPKQKRWYPVLQRYIEQIAGRVGGFGGNPGQILPSPTGQVPRLPHRPPPEPEGEGEEITGKIDGIIFDHFGDFRGFILETESGHHRRFVSREAPTLALVRRAWHERSRVTVLFRHERPHVPVEIILRSGGPGFWDHE